MGLSCGGHAPCGLQLCLPGGQAHRGCTQEADCLLLLIAQWGNQGVLSKGTSMSQTLAACLHPLNAARQGPCPYNRSNPQATPNSTKTCCRLSLGPGPSCPCPGCPR